MGSKVEACWLTKLNWSSDGKRGMEVLLKIVQIENFIIILQMFSLSSNYRLHRGGEGSRRYFLGFYLNTETYSIEQGWRRVRPSGSEGIRSSLVFRDSRILMIAFLFDPFNICSFNGCSCYFLHFCYDPHCCFLQFLQVSFLNLHLAKSSKFF